MDTTGRILLVASIVTCVLIQAQGADNYTDGNRPYEFGFSIDGEQHRHEKKDEKGLIEGEFGFITADGVYHVTVYATDEQGRFKILSMKNIRVKPYPTYTAKQTTTSARQGHSLELPASLQTSASPVVTTTTFKPISIEPPAKSCSHCSLPTTSTPSPLNPLVNSSPNQIGAAASPKFPQGLKPQSAFAGQPNGFNSPFPQHTDNYPAQPQNSLTTPVNPLDQGLVPPQNTQSFPQQQGPALGNNGLQGKPDGSRSNNPRYNTFPEQPQPNISPAGPASNYPGAENPQLVRGNLPSGRTPKRLDGGPSLGQVGSQPNSLQRGLPNSQGAPAIATKPTLISAQIQIVDKNTDIYKLGPGEKEGLPEGLNKDDMSNLLYTFNYTVGFHGHFEEGYTSGVKQGYYFVTGRNGVRTRVDYVADSKGFHPKISQEVLELLSEDVPKPETEKEEKYGLKGYEFKWLYYPTEAKGR